MNNIIKRVWNQNKMVNIEALQGMTFQAEDGGHTFQISGVDDTGAAVPLSGTVAGVFVRPDRADIALTGSASDGVVSVTLTDDCYAVPGRFGLTIFVTSSGQKTAVYAAVGTVSVTSGGGVAGDTPQDVVDLINAIEEAVASIPASYTGLIADIAPTYSSSAVYPVGAYVYYNGDLYRCTTPITTGESWTAAHWTAVTLGGEITDVTRSATDVKEMTDGLKTYSDLNYPNEKLSVAQTVSGYGLDGLGGYITGQGIRFAKYQVVPGRAYFIRCFSTTPGVWQWQSNAGVNQLHEYLIGTPSTQGANGVYIAPPGATWLILSEATTESGNAVYWLKDFDNIIHNTLRSGVFTISQGDLVNGTTSGTSLVASQTRICTARTFKCYPGDVIDFTPGSTVDKLVIVRYDNNNVFVSELTGWLGQTEYKLTEEGCYRFIFKNNSNSEITPTQYDCVTKIRSCFARISLLSDRDKCFDYVYKLNFERGDLYVNSSGQGTYYDSDSRLRTIKNHPVTLKKGDIVSLIDITYGVFMVYKKDDGLYTSVKAWGNRDLLITEDGEYDILIRWQTESTINFPDALANNLIVKSHFGTLHEGSNVENLVDTYKTAIETAITTATNKTTSRGLMFGVVTDTHLDNNRTAFYNQTMENLERLNNGLRFNGIFHLGDMINGYNSADIAKYHLRYAVDRLLKVAPDKTYILVGNHDNNNGAGDAERLTDTELYGIMQRFNEQYVVRTLPATDSVYDNQTSDYYVDYPDFKIRMIMFDSCYYSQGFSPTTIDWVSSVIASAPTDYHFVLVTHMSTEAELNGGSPIANAATFKALLAEYEERIYCYIHGHTHYDYVGYPNVFADIGLCSGVPDQPSSSVPEGGIQPSRTIGTVTQDCISVIIILPDEGKVELVRFGAGSDVSIPFRQS